MKLRVAVCMLVHGCAYGGSDADPLGGYTPDEVMTVADAASSAPPTSSMPPTSTPATPTGGSDAGKTTSDAAASAPNACMPAKAVATCDPIRNSGCPPLMQCDIDPSPASASGRCVFYSNPDGGQCTSSFVNVGCPAQNTCIAGACRKMCYCDSDCPQGETCSDTSGPGPAGAFKLCR